VVRCGKRGRELKMDQNEGGVGGVVVGIHRRYRTTVHRKLDFVSLTEYRN